MNEAFQEKARAAESATAENGESAPGTAKPWTGRLYSEMTPDNKHAPLYIVEGMLVLGETTLITADSGLGKTWLGFQLALCHAYQAGGVKFMRRMVRPIKAVYINMEMSQWDEDVRSHAVARKLDIEEDNLAFLCVNGDSQEERPTCENLEEKLKELVERQGWELKNLLVVIDTFGEIALGINENESGETAVVLKTLRQLARKYTLAVVLFHHTNKSGKAYRGSTAIRAGVDNLWYLRWAEDDELKKARERGYSKGFVVLACDKCRTGSGFATQHLKQTYIRRTRPAVDEFDTGEWDGFVWESLGDVGREDRPDKSAGDTSDEGPETVGAKDIPESTKERHARQVAEAFETSTIKYQHDVLVNRLIEVCHVSRRTANTMLAEAEALGLVKKWTTLVTNPATAPYALTADGSKAWTKVHGTAIRPEPVPVVQETAPGAGSDESA